jgi:hypothetical protein
MMTAENPAPRAKAGSRADIGVEQTFNTASASNWEAGAVAIEAAQGVGNVRAALLRDFVFEALAPVEIDAAAVRLCLRHDDDAGARYHLRRVVECVKAAASTFRELESLTGRNA